MAEYRLEGNKLVPMGTKGADEPKKPEVVRPSYTTASKATQTTKKVEIDPEIQRQIMAQVVDYKFGAQAEYTKPATYVLAANGSFCVKKTAFGTIAVPVKEIPYLTEVKAGFNLELPKAPYILFLQAYSFFKAVSDKSKDEAALVLYWNKTTKEYEYLCPEQTVSGAAVKFGECPVYLSRMNDSNFVRVCELHSHNTMSAFHSGTDDNDEVFDCSFIVFGKLDTTKPEHIFSYAASGVRVDSKLWDLFEKPIRHVDLGGGVIIEEELGEPMFAQVAYPETWHDQLSKYVYTAKAGGTYTGGYASSGWSDSWYSRYEELYGEDEVHGYGNVKTKGKSYWEKKEEDDEELEKEVEKKLTSKSYLVDRDYVDELNPIQDPDDIIYELENLYGSKFLDKIVDHAVKQGYGSEWYKSDVK